MELSHDNVAIYRVALTKLISIAKVRIIKSQKSATFEVKYYIEFLTIYYFKSSVSIQG
jgi:hypothetical protein